MTNEALDSARKALYWSYRLTHLANCQTKRPIAEEKCFWSSSIGHVGVLVLENDQRDISIGHSGTIFAQSVKQLQSSVMYNSLYTMF